MPARPPRCRRARQIQTPEIDPRRSKPRCRVLERNARRRARLEPPRKRLETSTRTWAANWPTCYRKPSSATRNGSIYPGAWQSSGRWPTRKMPTTRPRRRVPSRARQKQTPKDNPRSMKAPHYAPERNARRRARLEPPKEMPEARPRTWAVNSPPFCRRSSSATRTGSPCPGANRASREGGRSSCGSGRRFRPRPRRTTIAGSWTFSARAWWNSSTSTSGQCF
mmetsp:Transcript_57354/g.151037  ORF Transcript_57354/g.151037 Transcript_57354/m.151037 type:complete len:223 (-) Transcript_57354:230-898(-)